jgi:hypothetical protein
MASPRRLATVLLTACLCLPATAAARPMPSLVDAEGATIGGKWHRWLARSRMPLVRGRVQLIFGACPGVSGFSGCVITKEPRTVYINPGARSPRAVLYHELGHSFDLTLLRSADRERFRRILRMPGRRWFDGEAPLSELFAESYALCARFGLRKLTPSRLRWTGSVYGYHPSREQHKAACRIVLAAGGEARQRRGPEPHPPSNAPRVIELQHPQPPDDPPAEIDPLPTVAGLADPNDSPQFPVQNALPLGDD